MGYLLVEPVALFFICITIAVMVVCIHIENRGSK